MKNAIDVLKIGLAVIILAAAAFGTRQLLGTFELWPWADEGVASRGTKSKPSDSKSETSKESDMAESPDMAEPPVADRTPYVVGSQDAFQLTDELKLARRHLSKQQEDLARQRDVLEFVYADIRTEQDAVADTREQIGTELNKALKAARMDLQKMRTELDDANKENIRLKQEQQTRSEAPPTAEMLAKQEKNFKRWGAIFDSVAPENSASIFQKLSAEQDGIEEVANILFQMNVRKAAKVVDEMQNLDTKQIIDVIIKKIRMRDPKRADDLEMELKGLLPTN